MMRPETVIKMMLQTMLPTKFDTKIQLMTADKEPIEIQLKGDIFISRLKGQTKDRIFIALEIPEEEAKG